jgi:hypothetical protein
MGYTGVGAASQIENVLPTFPYSSAVCPAGAYLEVAGGML